MVNIRGTQLVSNNKDHIPFALMERIGQPDKIYWRIDCILVVIKTNICENCIKLRKIMQKIQKRIITGTNSVKTMHVSKEILTEKFDQQQKIIRK